MPVNTSGSGSGTAVQHTSGCGNASDTFTFTTNSLNSNGSGTANIGCGPGCGWNLNIQVAPDRSVFNASTDGFNMIFTFGTGFTGGPFGVLVDTIASAAPKPVFIGVQNAFFSQVYESTDGGATFAANASLGSLSDESIPILLDPSTAPETIFVHDSWQHDATITKLNHPGSHLLFSTGLGGSNDESGTGIAVDDDGGMYVTGITFSGDFPVTPAAVQRTFGGPFGGLINGFVSKLTSGEDGD